MEINFVSRHLIVGLLPLLNDVISDPSLTPSPSPPPPPVVPIVPMNRPLIPNGDARQTIINMITWMQTNAREGTYVKLSKYHGRSEKDVMA